MDLEANLGGRGRIVRALVTVALLVAAIRSLRNGKRMRGVAAGAGALAVGISAVTRSAGDGDALEQVPETESSTVDRDATETATIGRDKSEEQRAGQKSRLGAAMTCAACGDPIVAGERRGPNEAGDIVHERCIDNTAP